MDNTKLIQQCIKHDRKAQKALYDKYGSLFLGICIRYIGIREDAEDVFIHGMFKIFSKIESFNHDGSFEGWMRRIIVNECLMHIRKNKKHQLTVEIQDHDQIFEPLVFDNLAEEEIKQSILELPRGYRTVFNLYVIDGYKHREIAELLGISINTSKSQLILARKKLQEKIKKKAIVSKHERYR